MWGGLGGKEGWAAEERGPQGGGGGSVGWLVWARVLWKRYYWPGFSREMEPIGYTCVYHYKQMCMYILYIQIHRCREKVWGGEREGEGDRD